MADYNLSLGIESTSLFEELQRLKNAVTELQATAKQSGAVITQSLTEAANASKEVASQTVKVTGQLGIEAKAAGEAGIQFKSMLDSISKISGLSTKSFDSSQLQKFNSSLKDTRNQLLDIATKQTNAFDTSKVAELGFALQKTKDDFKQLQIIVEFIKNNIGDLNLSVGDTEGLQKAINQLEQLFNLTKEKVKIDIPVTVNDADIKDIATKIRVQTSGIQITPKINLDDEGQVRSMKDQFAFLVSELSKFSSTATSVFNTEQLAAYDASLKKIADELVAVATNEDNAFDQSKVAELLTGLQNAEGSLDQLKAVIGFIGENLNNIKLNPATISTLEDLIIKLEGLPPITINESGAIQTLQQLEAEASKVEVNFNALKTAIDNAQNELATLPAGSAEFNTLSAAIENATAKLNAEAQSIDQLKIKLSNLTISVGAETDVQQVAALNQEIDETKAAIDRLTNAGKEGFDNLGNKIVAFSDRATTLTTRIRAITNELAGMKAGDPRFNALINEAAQLQDQLQDTRQQIQLLASDTSRLDIGIQAVQGFVGVFTAAQGAIALFGDENEEVQKTLLKVNAAMAILQGLQQVGNLLDKNSAFNKAILVSLSKAQATTSQQHAVSVGEEAVSQQALNTAEAEGVVVTEGLTTAQQGLNTAMELNPAGILLLAIGALIGVYQIFSDKVAEATNGLKLQAAAQDLLNQKLDFNKDFNDKVIENLQRSGAERIAQMKAQGKSEQEIREQELKNLENQLNFIKANDEQIINEGEKAAARRKEIIDGIKKAAEEGGIDEQSALERVKPVLDALQVTAERGLEIERKGTELESQINIKRSENLASSNKEVDAKRKEDNQKAQAAYEKSLQLAQAYQAALASIQKQIRDTAISLLPSEREQQKAQATAQVQDQISAVDKIIEEQRKAGTLTNEIEQAAARERELLRQKLNNELLKIDADFYKKQQDLLDAANNAINDVTKSQTDLQIEQTREKFNSLITQLHEQNETILKQTNITSIDRETILENNSAIIRLDTQREETVTEIIVEESIKRLDFQEQIAIETVDALRIHGLTEEQLTTVKEQKKLEIVKEFTQKRFDLITSELLRENKLTEQQIIDLQDRLTFQHAAERGEDIFTFLGIDLSDDDKEKLQPVIKALNDVGISVDDVKEKAEDFNLTNFLGGLVGLTDEQTHQILDSFGSLFDGLNNLAEANAQKQIDAIDEIIDKLDEQIDAQQDLVDRQKDLSDEGLANDLRNQQRVLDDLKAKKEAEILAREEAQKRMEAIRKREAAIQAAGIVASTIETEVDLISAAAKAFKATAGIPFIGIALGIAAAAALVAAFLQIKAAMKKATEDIPTVRVLRHGGTIDTEGEVLQGPSHQDKGIGLYNEKTGHKIAEFEGREYLSVFNKESTEKHLSLIKEFTEAINKDMLPTTNFAAIHTILHDGRMPMERIERVVILQREIETIKMQRESDNKKELIELREEVTKFRKEFGSQYKGKVVRIDMGEYWLEKENGRTRRIYKR